MSLISGGDCILDYLDGTYSLLVEEQLTWHATELDEAKARLRGVPYGVRS